VPNNLDQPDAYCHCSALQKKGDIHKYTKRVSELAEVAHILFTPVVRRVFPGSGDDDLRHEKPHKTRKPQYGEYQAGFVYGCFFCANFNIVIHTIIIL